ncbi:MAG: SRPBCC family protein [Nocardioides sp.]|uniref:SRPBCC family protein n=1 Tax=Nocardioides sp. TaxID=35761 RepID=UPI0039E4778D
MSLESRHVSVFISADPAVVYDYASDPALLPEWAAGLAGGIDQEEGRWIARSPFGVVEVRFAPRNEFGVLDHEVVMPDGTVVLNPMRVVPAEGGAEVIFTVRRRDDMTAEQLASDVAAVEADLGALRRRLEARGRDR